MRRFIALALVLATASLGMPIGLLAQATTNVQQATVSGEALDAGGRALANERVELVQTGQVVQTTLTGSRGEWTFTNVAPGDYVVRVLVNGQVAGVRVTVAAGQSVANAAIVAPSAAVPSAAIFNNPRTTALALILIGGAIAATIYLITKS